MASAERLRYLRRRDGLIIAVAVASVAVYALVTHLMGGPGFPLDDSWIHQTYGRNLAQTGQWSFVPGIPSAGSTSPLYTLLLAAGYALGIPYMLWTHGLGAAALALAGLAGARMAGRLFPDVPRVGLWAGLALIVAWHLVWAAASGMETMLFGALCLVVINLALQEIDSVDSSAHLRARFLSGAAFGLAGAALIATRPEGVLLVGLTGLAMLIARPQPPGYPFLAWLGGALLGGLVGIAPYALLNLSLNGTLLPNTFSAKQAQNSPLLTQPFIVNLLAMLTPLTAGGQLLLVPGVLVAAARCIRQPWRRALLHGLPLAWSAALLLLYVLRLPAPYQHGRYVIPALPTFIVAGVGGTLLIAGQLRRPLLVRALARSLTIGTIVLFLIFWGIGAQTLGQDVQMINSEMVTAARWLAVNIPTDQLLAVHDIGAVGYFASSASDPRPILDIAGLVSPEVIPHFRNPTAMLALMRARDVRYLMVLPPQWDELWLGQPEHWASQFCEVFNARGLMGGMAIYEFREGGCSQG